QRQVRPLQRPTPTPWQSDAAVGACLQAIASAGTTPVRIACKAGSYSARALSRDCLGGAATRKESAPSPPPTTPCADPAAKQSHCRSLPAGDCVGGARGPEESPARHAPALPGPSRAVASAGRPPQKDQVQRRPAPTVRPGPAA